VVVVLAVVVVVAVASVDSEPVLPLLAQSSGADSALRSSGEWIYSA
jgi:hypothetical protein